MRGEAAKVVEGALPAPVEDRRGAEKLLVTRSVATSAAISGVGVVACQCRPLNVLRVDPMVLQTWQSWGASVAR